MNDIKPRAVRMHRGTASVIEERLGGPVSQRDLAERWSVSQATVSRWMTGVTLMPIDKAEELAREVDLPLSALLASPLTFPGASNGLDQREVGLLKRLAMALSGDDPVNVNPGTTAAGLFSPGFDPSFAIA
jgi:transcriptional regulator with XRE-family HTH domain